MKKVIVGFDPGTTVGIAVLSTGGEILKLTSQKNAKKGEIIEMILDVGNPILVATDKAKAPKAVLDLASEFGCKVFAPKEDIKIKQKINLVKKLNVVVEDDHQLDALTAAIKAWKAYRRKIQELEKAKIVAKKIEKNVEKKTTNKDLKFALTEKEKKIRYLLEQNKRLSKRINELKKELFAYKKLKLTFDELIEKCKKIPKLEKYINMLKGIERVKEKNLMPVIVLEKINSRQLEELNKYIGLENRVIFSNDLQNFKLLNSYPITCLLTEKNADDEELNFPAIKIKKENVEMFGKIAGVKQDFLNQKIKQMKKRRLIKWLEKYRRRKA